MKKEHAFFADLLTITTLPILIVRVFFFLIDKRVELAMIVIMAVVKYFFLGGGGSHPCSGLQSITKQSTFFFFVENDASDSGMA